MMDTALLYAAGSRKTNEEPDMSTLRRIRKGSECFFEHLQGLLPAFSRVQAFTAFVVKRAVSCTASLSFAATQNQSPFH